MIFDYNLYPLHVFRLVARHGSATRAAESLSISQPAVSAHLRTLEVALGVALFERTPRRMILTGAGGCLLEQADRLFLLCEELPQIIDQQQGRVRGEVLIAASSTPGAYLLPRLLRQFELRYPEVRPLPQIADSSTVLEWILEYQVPFGIIGEIALPQIIETQEIASDSLQLVAAPGDPLLQLQQVEPEDLAGRTLFVREKGSSTRKSLERAFGSYLPHFQRLVEIPGTEAIKQSVIAGLGVAVLSSWSIELEAAAGLLASVVDRRWHLARRFFLAKRSDRVPGGAAAALWDLISREGRRDSSPAFGGSDLS